jgi:LacI family transcriptional regulator
LKSFARLNAQRKTTLREVAAAAGVSLATASYAINGNTATADSTRAHVLKVAKELGYVARSRQTAVGPRSNSTRIRAVLSPTVNTGGEPLPEHINTPNYYVAELLAAVQEEAEALDYQLDVVVWDDARPGLVRERDVAGLLFLGGSFPRDLERRAPDHAVLVGTALPHSRFDAVLADNRTGSYLAVEHLIERGRTRIALINGPERTMTSESKRQGHRDALAAHGLEADERLLMVGDFTVASGYRLAEELLEMRLGPDAIFVADDPMGIGALQALQDHGVRVPDDVAVVGYGDSAAGQFTRPALSTVRVFQHRMGVLGIRRLVECIRGEAEERVRILVSPTLVPRASS